VKRQKRQRGATLIESALVIVVVSLIFFGLFQVSLLFEASQILDFAAYTTARSRTVGFNDGIVTKAFQVSSIPNAGAMLVPTQGLTQRQQLAVEEQLISPYLQNVAALDYANWPTHGAIMGATVQDDNLEVQVTTWQLYPMVVPMRAAYYSQGSIWLEGGAGMENHYPYYLQSQ
jgi:Flp pilus assembly protein TadG